MVFKAYLISVSALIIQSTYSQVIAGLGTSNRGNLGWNGGIGGLNGLGCDCGGVASTGGGLPVSSASPCAPVGIFVTSETTYEGVLSAGGNVPFIGTVAFEGILPTLGAGAVSYGCGNGTVGIASEGPIPTGILSRDFSPFNSGIYGLDGTKFGLNGIYGLSGISYGIGGLGCGGIY